MAEKASTSRTRKLWTDDDIDILLDEIGSKPLQFVAKKLERTPAACMAKAAQLGVNQRTNLGKEPLCRVSDLFGIQRPEVFRWMKLGLQSSRGPLSGPGESRLFDLGDVQRFLIGRPELWKPDDVNPRLLKKAGISYEELNAACTRFKWKRLCCKRADEHSNGQPIWFWTELRTPRPHCPSCGGVCPNIAVGDKLKRYAKERPVEPPYPLSKAADQVLQRLCHGASSIANLHRDLGFSSYSKTYFTCCSLAKAGLLSHKGRAFSITEKGRALCR